MHEYLVLQLIGFSGALFCHRQCKITPTHCLNLALMEGKNIPLNWNTAIMRAELAQTAFPVVSWWSLLREHPLAVPFLKTSLDLQSV